MESVAEQIARELSPLARRALVRAFQTQGLILRTGTANSLARRDLVRLIPSPYGGAEARTTELGAAVVAAIDYLKLER